MTAPKLFISYSWTSQEHMDWVVQLATDLRQNGVDAILDKWHLKEGQDAHSFMERMVTDAGVTKVAVICDRKYVERADAREGGVGTESQIMSGKLYGRVDQTKFVAICRDKDENGRALLPVFFKSRIYVDLSEDADFSQSFEQLLRWCFDKPLFVEPELGTPPTFLDERSSVIVAQSATFERALRSPTPQPEAVVGSATQFLRDISHTSVNFVVTAEEGEALDDTVVRSIEGLSPIISRLFRVLERAMQSNESDELFEAFHDYIEKIIPYLDIGPRQSSADVTKFYAHFILIGFLAILIRNRRFEQAKSFLDTPFLKQQYDGLTAKSTSYEVFRPHLRSLEARNERLRLRRLSLHADLIKQVCTSAGFDFNDFVQADFILYLRGAAAGHEEGSHYYLGWWPHSLLYASNVDGALPIFARADQPRIRDRLFHLLGIESKTGLEILIGKFASQTISPPAWSGGFSRPNVLELMNATRLLASYA